MSYVFLIPKLELLISSKLAPRTQGTNSCGQPSEAAKLPPPSVMSSNWAVGDRMPLRLWFTKSTAKPWKMHLWLLRAVLLGRRAPSSHALPAELSSGTGVQGNLRSTHVGTFWKMLPLL